MNIYIGNFANDVTEEDLTSVFNAYGRIESIRIVKDKFTGESRGFGFVDMPDNREAKTALEGIREVKGRNVTINEARPQEGRTGGGRGVWANKGTRDNRRRSY